MLAGNGNVSSFRVCRKPNDDNLGGGNSNIFYFHPYLGMISILTKFQLG